MITVDDSKYSLVNNQLIKRCTILSPYFITKLYDSCCLNGEKDNKATIVMFRRPCREGGPCHYKNEKYNAHTTHVKGTESNTNNPYGHWHKLAMKNVSLTSPASCGPITFPNIATGTNYIHRLSTPPPLYPYTLAPLPPSLVPLAPDPLVPQPVAPDPLAPYPLAPYPFLTATTCL